MTVNEAAEEVCKLREDRPGWVTAPADANDPVSVFWMDAEGFRHDGSGATWDEAMDQAKNSRILTPSDATITAAAEDLI